MEELEGTSFPYGFESDEQTIKACLEFAFEGTGWHVGTCTVTKKRTIDEQENVTAWDVLQKCLTTYRCECIIHSLTKTIDIYDRVGSDKGCYFMEGLNLRKISMKSDTYDFYTRIYPIGKDGITPKWLTGKDYIDNFQYSSKIKAYVWKDERYTNTTSLIEDATAKIEEMSRPYKAYTAEVVDLAKASEKYKDILSYGIGDTVTLVSKKTRTREKQRIVKITEYPESPKKNTVEISNARKTFAEIQKEETDSAKTDAISIANETTKKVLRDDYYTKKEIESHITASEKKISLGVSKKLEKYSTTQETNEIIDEKLTEYSTTEEMRSAIEMTAKNIKQTVAKKVGSDEIISSINQSAEDVTINASKINFNGIVTANSRFKILKDGSFDAAYGNVGGWKVRKGYIQSSNSTITLYSDGRIEIGNATISSVSHACVVKYGMHIYAGTEGFSDGSDSIKLFNLTHVSSGGHMVFGKDGSTVCYLSSSSKRYKNHVSDMTEDEAKSILDIPIVWFKYKEGYLNTKDWLYGKKIPGFYAEDVFEKFPEAAQLNEKGEPEDWNYRTIIPAMLKLIQELYKEKK